MPGSRPPDLDCNPLPGSPFHYQPPVVTRGSIFPHCRIGAWSGLNGGILRWHTHIGRYCSIGYNVAIGLPNHDAALISTHAFATRAPQDKETVPAPKTPARDNQGPTVIEHDVWIGHGVMIRGTVKIGTGAILAAGAVVMEDVPPYAIIGGVPGKIIGWRFDPEFREMLLASQWWAYPHELLTTLPTNNIPKFVDALRRHGPPPEDEPWRML